MGGYVCQHTHQIDRASCEGLKPVLQPGHLDEKTAIWNTNAYEPSQGFLKDCLPLPG
jgi:hypothetical protein